MAVQTERNAVTPRDAVSSLAALLASLGLGVGGLGTIRVLRNFPRNQVRMLDDLLWEIKRRDEPLWESLAYDYPKGTFIRPSQRTAEQFGESRYNQLRPKTGPVEILVHPEILQDQYYDQAVRTLYHEMLHPEFSQLPIRSIRERVLRAPEMLPIEDLVAYSNHPQDYSGRLGLEELAVRLAELEFARSMGLPDVPSITSLPQRLPSVPRSFRTP